MCWCWLSFIICAVSGIVAVYFLCVVVLGLCMLTAREVDEHGNPIAKVQNDGQ